MVLGASPLGQRGLGRGRGLESLALSLQDTCTFNQMCYELIMTTKYFAAAMNLFRAHALWEERFTGELGAIHGLSVQDTLLLLQVNAAPMARLSRVELSKRLHVSASTATRMVLPLEKRGILDRAADEHDARIVYVVLTRAGAALADDVRATLERRCAELFKEGWSAQDVSTLAKLLGRLVHGQPGILT